MASEVDIDHIWACAYKARSNLDVDLGSASDEQVCLSIAGTSQHAALEMAGSKVYKLPDGDFHVCIGYNCPHVVLDNNHVLTCRLSGMCVGETLTREHDASWTGRSTTSANPDDTAGMPQGGWSKRKDMFAASVDAWNIARELTAEQCADPVYVETEAEKEARIKKETASSKRGARCVDDLSKPQIKKHRPSKRNAESAKQIAKLQTEAKLVVNRLLSTNGNVPSVAAAASAAATNAAAVSAAEAARREMPPPQAHPKQQEQLHAAQPTFDKRLVDIDFVRTMAIRKYARNVEAGTMPHSLSALHDVCVHANTFVAKQKLIKAEADRKFKAQHAEAESISYTASQAAKSAAVEASNGKKKRRINVVNKFSLNGKTLEMVVILIVMLWKAICITPHMTATQRGNDSFRPFVSAVLYALKRGLQLPSGMKLLPQFPELTQDLPALRSATASPAAKQLQSASHRGMCSIHRSIASTSQQMPEDRRRQMDEAFRCVNNVCLALIDYLK